MHTQFDIACVSNHADVVAHAQTVIYNIDLYTRKHAILHLPHTADPDWRLLGAGSACIYVWQIHEALYCYTHKLIE